LQGEVEQISMMAPKAHGPHDEGLLEYLEDIIGSDKYVEPIEQEAAKLEALNEQRAGMVHRLKMTEKDRDSLEDSKVRQRSAGGERMRMASRCQ
jgi:structural maintenance of chromosome 4